MGALGPEGQARSPTVCALQPGPEPGHGVSLLSRSGRLSCLESGRSRGRAGWTGLA